MEPENRVVVLIDMDCFYCQVEEKLKPELAGKPIAVVQYNPWKGGGIIAVNYVARAMGVDRHMRGDEAKEKCPEIILPVVPSSRGKADITIYREAGKDVAKVLQKFTPLLERASIDEAYLDITAPVQERLKTLSPNMVTTSLIPNTFALGYEGVEEFLSDVHNGGSESMYFDYEHASRLLVGAVIVSEIRAAVFEETGYRCSAGIAHNKILAKLVCGMNKPNKQTVLPKHSVDILYKTLSVKKVKHLGGKFGDTVCELLNISKMAELQKFSEKHLQNLFDDKNGTWLYNIARGVDLEPVQARFNPKSIGCCKNFKGKAALLDLDSLRKWLKDLGDEIEDRLEKDALENNRTPKQMVVSFSTQMPDGRDTSSSRSYNFAFEEELCGELFSNKALELLMESSEGTKVKDGESNRRLKAPIKFLGISVGKFEDLAEVKKTRKIKDYFGAGASKVDTHKPRDIFKQNIETKSSKNNNDKEYIMRKFFQIADKTKEVDDKVGDASNQEEEKPKMDVPDPVEKVESSLEEQESFFARLLSRKIDSDARSVGSDSSQLTINQPPAKPTTPVCDVVNCGDNSNETCYSTSTINEEINKSIALFDDDPHEIDRVINMRKLLNSTMINTDNDKLDTETDEIIIPKDSIPTLTSKDQSSNPTVFLKDTVMNCSECGKNIPVAMTATHADFHLALKLRDEERQQVRADVREKQLSMRNKKGKPPEENVSKNDSVASISIASYLVKLDDTIPTVTCPECGKKVPVEKVSEHTDFHEAQKLSRELNRRPTPLVSTDVNKKVNVTGSVKRKRKSTSPVKKLKMPKCKSIESFFKIT